MPQHFDDRTPIIISAGQTLGAGDTIDLNGNADGLILDADGNTTISANTNDQIEFQIGGAVDFEMTANTLQAMSGSVIATDTITETTGGVGVTIDSVLHKDGVVYSPSLVAAASVDGAITIAAFSKTHFITKAGVAALTIADPTSGTHDGVVLTFIAATANAHTLDNSAGSGFFSSGGATKDVATFGGAIGDRISIIAYLGKWYILDSLNITLG